MTSVSEWVRKRWPWPDQFVTQLFVVVDFTIESDADRAVFVVERLVSLLEVDDAQANMAEGKRTTVEQGIARAIRPTVADRRTHPRDVFALGRTAILSQDHVNATHEVRRCFSVSADESKGSSYRLG